MTTYLTTEQAVELAEKHLLGVHTAIVRSKIHALCNAAIAAYINSLAEGLPEPFTHYRYYDEQVQPFATEDTIPLYTRDQLLAAVAKAKGER